MAKYMKAVSMPGNTQSVSVEQMASVSILDSGVGVFDSRNRMIAWVEVEDRVKAQRVYDLLLEIINNPRRAKQPDWSFLAEDVADTSASTVVEARAVAVMPTRISAAPTTPAVNTKVAATGT